MPDRASGSLALAPPTSPCAAASPIRRSSESRAAKSIAVAATLATAAFLLASPRAAAAAACARTVKARVVVLDQPLVFNRLGAQNVNGIIYALERDVVPVPPDANDPNAPAVKLRPDKRPRPLVLRVAAGDCLEVTLRNHLTPTANPFNATPAELHVDDQVASRLAGFHVNGLQLVGGMQSDASYVGRNGNGLVAPGGSPAVYTYFAEKEGTYLVTSQGATFGGDGMAGNNSSGMFAVVNVEPRGARFYRSQVTEEELRLGTKRDDAGDVVTTATGQPVIDYGATYPATVQVGDQTEPSVWAQEGKAGLPIFEMVQGNQIVHSDLNAIIAGPNPDGSFPPDTYPLEGKGLRNPSIPNRLEAFREFTVVFHDETASSNAFPAWFNHPVVGYTLHAVGDVFMVNYGSGGVGSEVIANRLGVGPMHDCLECAYEEFFLASSAVGDPAMIVDTPANAGLEACAPAAPATCPADKRGPKAKKAFYPDDPSNVHHAYMGDFTKFRNVHTGNEHHIFHLHNHQWLFNPNDDNSNYLDAQGIGPGGAYTYEINFGGAGNRNKSAGDAIFHCHFYPHFAQGMWALWRIHDVLETGTPLAVSGAPGSYHTEPYALRDGEPLAVELSDPGDGGAPVATARARALPDGEIAAGTPIPAVVPLPGKALPPLPGRVTVVPRTAGGKPVGSVARVDRTDTSTELVDDAPQPLYEGGLNPTGLKNPGYPFWIAGVETTVGQRSTTPPLDMEPSAGGFDGGLPRHALDGYLASGCVAADGTGDGEPRAACAAGVETRWDLTKEIHKAKPVMFPERGTDLERAAMSFHSRREHASSALLVGGDVQPDVSFVTNGAPPVPGAPYHDPCIDDVGRRVERGMPNAFFSSLPGALGVSGAIEFGASNPRVYKGANIQYDAVLNKLGYHFPQQRIITLWSDAIPTIRKERAGEPLVMRMNTFDCVMYHHTNLVPSVYELDDFQVRTTTDIIGQHIHLPKWDLTTTDGSANGWNYEDGTFSPDAVRERIHAINEYNTAHSTGAAELTPGEHPFFGATGPGNFDWRGARTTLQRWFSDPVVNVSGEHRGLGIIFTHDHFGPSTHQQVGLYATMLVEPPGSTWVQNETGQKLYDPATRSDGGPTSWQAAIITPDGKDNHREFYLEYTDFQLAYRPGAYVGRGADGSIAPPYPGSYRDAVNPPHRLTLAPDRVFPDLLYYPNTCPGGVPRPCPEAISAADPGFLVVNYRNEPLGFRVYDPAQPGPDGKPGAQAQGLAGDLAFALQSRTDRKIAELNRQPGLGTNIRGTVFPRPLQTSPKAGDPFTPLIRAYYGDKVRIKIQAGGDEESHNATVYGQKWLQGGSGYGSAGNSGWRASQHAGISEQFTFTASAMPMMNGGQKADQLWSTNPSLDGFWNGVWGIYRSYGQPQSDLPPLPGAVTLPLTITNAADFSGVCPKSARIRAYDVTAVLANDVLDNAFNATIVPADASARMNVGAKVGGGVSGTTALNPNGGTLVYNPRAGSGANRGALHDPTALLWVRTSDLVAVNPTDPGCISNKRLDPTLSTCRVKLRATTCSTKGVCQPGAPIEPVVIRAAAGECLQVTVRNRLPAALPDLAGYKHLPSIVMRAHPLDSLAGSQNELTSFNNNLIRPSSYVGLHPQLVSYDVNKDDGTAVGDNGIGNDAAGVLVAPGVRKTYQWYAGDLTAKPAAGGVQIVATAVEFGGANIAPADVVKQGQKGLAGALVVEPPGSTWTETDVALDRQIAPGTNATCLDDAQKTKAACQRQTRASTTVNGATRDLVAVVLKGQNLRYRDGAAVEMIGGEGPLAEDSEESGQASINYGVEPMWLRFGLAPHAPSGRVAEGGESALAGYGSVPNAFAAYSNTLTGGEPATPVFKAPLGAQVRLHLLAPTGSNRASTFALHGHGWQRDPYVCPGSSDAGLPGKCGGNELGSRAIGYNPVGKFMSAQDLVMPGAHFTLRIPRAGGEFGIGGDYLFSDRSGIGNASGLWSILRVE